MNRPIATALDDLTSELHEVAVQARRNGCDVWDWHMSDVDAAAVRHACYTLGTMAMHQERLPNGALRLIAKLIPAAKASGTHARPVQSFGVPQVADSVPKPLEMPPGSFAGHVARPALARVPRSPKAWHPEDDVKRARLRLAASGGVGSLMDAESDVPNAAKGDTA